MWKTWSHPFQLKSSGVMGSGSRHTNHCWTRPILCKGCPTSLSTAQNPYCWWSMIKCTVWINALAVYSPKGVIIETSVSFTSCKICSTNIKNIAPSAWMLTTWWWVPDRSFIQADVSGKNPLRSSSLCTSDSAGSRISCGRFETKQARRDALAKSYFPWRPTRSLCGRYIRQGVRIGDH